MAAFFSPNAFNEASWMAPDIPDGALPFPA
jgi:hypothetical protein